MKIQELSYYEQLQRPKRIIKPAEAYRIIGISSSEGERRVINDAHFPKKVRLGPRSVGYVLTEVEAYIDHLIAAPRPSNPRPTSKPQAASLPTRPARKPERVAPLNSGPAPEKRHEADALHPPRKRPQVTRKACQEVRPPERRVHAPPSNQA